MLLQLGPEAVKNFLLRSNEIVRENHLRQQGLVSNADMLKVIIFFFSKLERT